MQLSQSEPAVRHALAAVGALNECRDVHVKDITVQLHPQWTTLVKQVWGGEPAVRHAMVAVGDFNEREDFRARGTPCGKSFVSSSARNVEASVRREQEHHNNPFALSQYNKAITHLT
jgi:endonuclease/exonuclease/phosphatase family metal-dependent hydrolase